MSNCDFNHRHTGKENLGENFGTTESFSAKRYREESGKDYKRITLYLCRKDYLRRNEDISLSSETEDECEQPVEKRSKSQVDQDELIARELQHRFNNESCDNDKVNIGEDQEDVLIISGDEISMQLPDESDQSKEVLSNDDQGNTDPKQTNKESNSYQSVVDLVENLGRQVDESDQFFFVIRRGTTLKRQLTIWQREASKKSPKHRVRVRFTGESGIDNGALAEEFFTSVVSDIGKNIFPNGSPQDSMLNVHNGTFYTCGEIVSSSIANGGPPPCFLEECVYNMLVEGDVDTKTLVPENHLTTHEQEVLEGIKKNPTAMRDVILEHGCTGKVDNDHINDVVGTVMISLVSKRLLYLNEFRKGLDLFGLQALMQANSLLCKQLFVTGHGGKAPDANYVVSCLIPCYSEAGSSRRAIEEEMVDHFQDLLISLEDERVPGYSEDLAWNDGEDSIPGTGDGDETSSCYSADLTPAGVLKWLTGQKHVPINGENLKIQVYFNHDCTTRNNLHTICFPVVGSCGKDITLPVEHMKISEDFKRVFLLAFCKGQTFGRS